MAKMTGWPMQWHLHDSLKCLDHLTALVHLLIEEEASM